MEAAGLAVGVFALVGVFEDCITLLSQVATAKSIAQDYTRLETKLDFQKLFLLQWADRLSLFSAQYDRRLDDPSIRSMVERGLYCIRDLFRDTEELQELYGVRHVQANDETTSFSAVSDRLMGCFRQNSAAVRCLIGKERRNGYSNLTKVKWVVRDKEKFESLIRELSDLVASLDKVLPPREGNRSAQAALKDEVRGLHNINVLRRVLDASTDENVDLTAVTEDTITQEYYRLILNRLWFRLIEDRKSAIAEEHPATLEWAIHPPSGKRAWSDLSKWLRQDYGIYWISGKPGSGKSTLMKYLLKHPGVMIMLEEWAGNRSLTVAAFFVWNIGSPEQNSLAGLTRGLLYNVLLQDRSLIPMILPGMWREVQNGDIKLSLPSQSETNEAFRRLGKETKGTAYAFFIDGIDEFTGNHRDCTAFIQELGRSQNMKLVVSSRPIDACEAAFSLDPKLALQDLTKRDIDMYITDTIGSHQYVIKKMVDGVIVSQLIDDLKKKAEGVFLWVVLACRMLIEGFQAHDNAAELQKRVEELPPELEDLFRHILGKIPSRFLDHTAKFLRVCWTNRKQALNREISSDSGIPALALSWADENEFEIDGLGNFKKWSLEEMSHNCSMLKGRLRSRCMGLLEIHHSIVFSNSKLENFDVSSLQVDFMHRTLFEFLNTPGVWELECLTIHDQTFDATTVLTYMSAQILYITTCDNTTESLFGCLCVDYLHLLQNSVLEHLQSALVKLTSALLQIQHKDGKPVWSNYLSSSEREKVEADDSDYSCSTTGIRGIEIDDSHLDQPLGPVHHSFPLDQSVLLLAIEFGLSRYVSDRLESTTKEIQMQHLYPQLRYPLLYHAIQLPLLSSLSIIHDEKTRIRGQSFHMAVICAKTPPVELIRVLLQNACNPNEQFLNPEGTFTTPWIIWLEKCSSIIGRVGLDFDRYIPFAEATSMMLQASTDDKPPDLEGVGISSAQGREGEGELLRITEIWVRSTTAFRGENRETHRTRLITACKEIIRVMV